MINKSSIQAVDQSRFGPFTKPLYDSYCFSKIPHTVCALLTGETTNSLPQDTVQKGDYDFVLVMLLDSFGWKYFEEFAPKYPFLQRFIDEGIASKITSQFPSTTTNHLTSIHTGLSVGQSGLYEWFYYEPLVDACICPLHFSYAKDKSFNTLTTAGITSEQIFPFGTIYQKLQKQGIRSVAFQEKDTANSPYSKAMYKGAELIGYKHFNEGLSKLAHAINGVKEKTYFFFYFGDIDSKGHEFGPDSTEVAAQIDKCFSRLEKFYQELMSKKQNGCFILTADHGMAKIDPKSTWFINKKLPHFADYIKQNKKGDLIVPCGSSRDMFLHIKDEYLDKAYNELSVALAGIAEVHMTSELISKGFFGPVTDRFMKRVGNLVVIALGQTPIWWYEENKDDNPKHGHHGGLTHAEMESIFLFQLLQNK